MSAVYQYVTWKFSVCEGLSLVGCMACNWVDGYNSAASVFRVEEPFLKMEAAPSSESLVFFCQSTRRYIPESSSLTNSCSEKTIYHLLCVFWRKCYCNYFLKSTEMFVPLTYILAVRTGLCLCKSKWRQKRDCFHPTNIRSLGLNVIVVGTVKGYWSAVRDNRQQVKVKRSRIMWW